MLRLVTWDNFQKINYPNKAYDTFIEIISTFYDEAFPKIKIKTKTKNLLSPGITKGLIKSSKQKQRLYEKI